ncbi:MAG: helix-turn-helix transcriptional regulator [Flavipsychrobacter sp.]|nr:helix-turn-helix transcriptional regulator [Flavipsychrobacter sp.]
MQFLKLAIDIIQVHTDAPIERILGQPARVLTREQVSMNSYVHAEWIEVNFENAVWPEEHARLNLFPIGDGQFCVQLLYMQYADEPGNANICWIEFRPEFFDQYPLSMLSAEEPFRFDEVREQQFSICSQTTKLLTEIREVQSPSALRKALQQTEIALQMLRRALDCIALPFTVCPVPACRFLAYDSEREKVLEARKLIEQNIEQSFTIKDLSRRVAMNECYLKKGFKALVGKTIHEFQQDLRIAKAKDMLQQPGFSVSDVANSLGYSSISHFSTAFKKATGLKPCELLR